MSFDYPVIHRILASVLIATPLLLAGAQPVGAQVTIFKSPPTVEQFRQALSGKSMVNPRGSVSKPLNLGRTRGLSWWGDEQESASANDAKSGDLLAAQSAIAPVQPVTTANSEATGAAAGLPISFAQGSSSIAERSRAYINTVVQVMRDDPTISLVIEGHTDASGSYPRNMVLSWERAMGVYKVLVQRYGIAPKRLLPVGKGPNEPLPGVAADNGENRRVQFRLRG